MFRGDLVFVDLFFFSRRCFVAIFCVVRSCFRTLFVDQVSIFYVGLGFWHCFQTLFAYTCLGPWCVALFVDLVFWPCLKAFLGPCCLAFIFDLVILTLLLHIFVDVLFDIVLRPCFLNLALDIVNYLGLFGQCCLTLLIFWHCFSTMYDLSIVSTFFFWAVLFDLVFWPCLFDFVALV